MNLIDLNYLSFSIYFLFKEMKIYGFFIDSFFLQIKKKRKKININFYLQKND